MLFGQRSARKSLRELVFSINRQAHKLCHLGLSKVRRSTLSDANKLRPAVIFEKTYYKLYDRVSAELTPQPQKAPQIKIIDATTIDLCAAVNNYLNISETFSIQLLWDRISYRQNT